LQHVDEFQDRRDCLGLFFPAGDDLHLAGKFSQQMKINRRSAAAEANFQTQKNSPPGRRSFAARKSFKEYGLVQQYL